MAHLEVEGGSLEAAGVVEAAVGTKARAT